jgi:FkbM family methyltransferase
MVDLNILHQLIYSVQSAQNILFKKSEELQFVGECLVNANQTYSQNYQDVFVLYETAYKKGGYFVEFGATNGKTGSNTLLLEKRHGWKGILAEPNEVWHNDLFKNRICNISKKCVYSESGKEIEFIASDAPDISGIKEFAAKDEHTENRSKGKTILVPTISLVDLLDEYKAPNDIDYLSIDTEGSEFHILKAFFDAPKDYVIQNITVEHNYVEEDRTNLFNLLSSNGYKRKFTAFSRCDDFYTKVR